MSIQYGKPPKCSTAFSAVAFGTVTGPRRKKKGRTLSPEKYAAIKEKKRKRRKRQWKSSSYNRRLFHRRSSVQYRWRRDMLIENVRANYVIPATNFSSTPADHEKLAKYINEIDVTKMHVAVIRLILQRVQPDHRSPKVVQAAKNLYRRAIPYYIRRFGLSNAHSRVFCYISQRWHICVYGKNWRKVLGKKWHQNKRKNN